MARNRQTGKKVFDKLNIFYPMKFKEQQYTISTRFLEFVFLYNLLNSIFQINVTGSEIFSEITLKIVMYDSFEEILCGNIIKKFLRVYINEVILFTWKTGRNPNSISLQFLLTTLM